VSDDTPMDPSLRLIISVLEDYADWYGHVVRRIFYPDTDNMLNPVLAPKSFATWKDTILKTQSLDIGELDRISKLQRELHNVSDKLIGDSFKENRRPDYESFNEFANLFDDLLQRLRRIEADHYLSGRGYDAVTGLRSHQVMIKDLEREMERLARRGRSFSLVVARLEDAEDLQARLGEGYNRVMAWIGAAVLYTIRTFDDAYRYNDSEFLMSLKHSDIQGAQRFVDRLKAHLSGNPLILGGAQVDAKLSFVVAEPVAGEDLPKFVEQMRKDLAKAGGMGDAVVRYEEVSPLQRFLSEGGGS
jgi:GGDEF domain-containing protein